MSLPVSKQEGVILIAAREKYNPIFLNDSSGQWLAILAHFSSLFKFVRLMDTLVLASKKDSSKFIKIGSSSFFSWPIKESQNLCLDWSF